MGVEVVAFDPAPIASFLDDIGKSNLKSYSNIQNFRNGSDPLTAIDAGIIGEKPMTISATNDVDLSNLWDLGGWLDIAETNHSSSGLAIAMSSVEYARCYLTPCPPR